MFPTILLNQPTVQYKIGQVNIYKKKKIIFNLSKQANFCGSLQSSRAEIENFTNFFPRLCAKPFEIESQFFAAMLFGPSTVPTYITLFLLKMFFKVKIFLTYGWSL